MNRRLFGWGITLLPKNAFSRMMGFLARFERPVFLIQWVIQKFVIAYGVKMEESLKPLAAFKSFNQFFTRALKPGVRAVDDENLSIISPCDGAFGACGSIQDGKALQIKGRSYSIQELLATYSAPHEGEYATVYLSPKDYHRFHAPCDMEVLSATHVPGHLWPVNPWAVENVNELFCKNERVVLQCQSIASEPFYMVLVGATVVGKINIYAANLPKYRSGSQEELPWRGSRNFKKGQELGCFELGSTIVIILPQETGGFQGLSFGQSICMGQQVGILS